ALSSASRAAASSSAPARTRRRAMPVMPTRLAFTAAFIPSHPSSRSRPTVAHVPGAALLSSGAAKPKPARQGLEPAGGEGRGEAGAGPWVGPGSPVKGAGLGLAQIHRVEVHERAHPAWMQHALHLSAQRGDVHRSEEHTSELQSREKLVCRLLLQKTKPP